MSWPVPACASAAAVSLSFSPCEVMKSILTSTLFLVPHSLQSAANALLAPGTQ